MAYSGEPNPNSALHFYTRDFTLHFIRREGKLKIAWKSASSKHGNQHDNFKLSEFDVAEVCKLIIDEFDKDNLYVERVL
jgi:hypothetical protein